MLRLLLLSIVLLCSCASPMLVGERDLNAWRGVPLKELESHPVFSKLSVSRMVYSNGDILYNYHNDRTIAEATDCYSQGGSNYCSGGKEVRCTNQFIIRKDKILEYRAIGKCYADCRLWPTSKSCEEK